MKYLLNKVAILENVVAGSAPIAFYGNQSLVKDKYIKPKRKDNDK